jgi:hypothetical protein
VGGGSSQAGGSSGADTAASGGGLRTPVSRPPSGSGARSGRGGGSGAHRRQSNYPEPKSLPLATNEWGFPTWPVQLLAAGLSGDVDGDGSHRRVFLVAGDPFATIVTHSGPPPGAAELLRVAPLPLCGSSGGHSSPPGFDFSPAAALASPHASHGSYGRPASAMLAPRPPSARRPPGGNNSGIGSGSGSGIGGGMGSSMSGGGGFASPASPRVFVGSPRAAKGLAAAGNGLRPSRPVSARGGAKRAASPPMLRGDITAALGGGASLDLDRLLGSHPEHASPPPSSPVRDAGGGGGQPANRSPPLNSIGDGDDGEEEDIEDDSAYLESSLDFEFLGLFSN